MFSMNGYPMSTFDRCLQSFLNRKVGDDIVCKESKEKPKYILTLPYIGYPSMNLKRQISKTYRNMGIDIMIVFKSFKVRNYFLAEECYPLCSESQSHMNSCALVMRVCLTSGRLSDI